ncbi:conserved hypothetical protein [Candidatus Desulfarcum epimagneticum]|uniref:ATP-grasp domain-containing protein n=1 Tax=uncultured Desulfobacteraceae bacterium TaxID=218296 RepID=A0A484HLN8_9BACT|nr:conserved hypothetical protein [uncultured Desulfobacteraceae bacterium]
MGRLQCFCLLCQVSIHLRRTIIPNLEKFMPRVLKGELPGMAFNLSYGIQGHARYTHVPGILEMVGIPYMGSNPLAHSLALDKVVAKMIFRQNDLPTPDFSVLNEPGFDMPNLDFPLIVKPKNEAVSMGIRIVHDLKELKDAAGVIFDQFNQPVLVEQYIEGREINVGLLGNNPPEILPPCEITFGNQGPHIYTIEDKKGKSGRKIDWICPAPISRELTEKAHDIALRAFQALGCYDMARVDMRLDNNDNLYILEINSLPSLGEHGSYTIAANHVGLDFPALVNRMVEVASARYFGTPSPPDIRHNKKKPEEAIFSYVTQRRDLIEKALENWSSLSSRTSDPVGIQLAIKKLEKKMTEIKMKPAPQFCKSQLVHTWETKKGMADGTLLIVHCDVPLELEMPNQGFRREPEWLYGEGVGCSRAPMVVLEYALRALRHQRRLHKLPLGVLCYMDEGRDARYSEEIIRAAVSISKKVIVLRPGSSLNHIIVQRRGQRKCRLIVQGKARRLGKKDKQPEVLLWTMKKLDEISRLSSTKNKIAVSSTEIKTKSYPMLLPHHVSATLLLSYLDTKTGNETEISIREITGVRFK